MPTEAPRPSARVPLDDAAPASQWSAPHRVLELPLYAVAEWPLRAGRVQATRPPGAKVFVRLRYVVEGARPLTDFTARLLVHLFDPTCTNTPLVFSSAPLRTDGMGDGATTVSIRPEEVPASVRGAEHGFRLEVAHEGKVAYRTDCTAARID